METGRAPGVSPAVEAWLFNQLPENIDWSVLAHNLDMVDSLDTVMNDLLGGEPGESMDGNGSMACIDGHHYPCAVAHGYYEPGSGAIVTFGDRHSVSPDIVRLFPEFAYRVIAERRPGREYGAAVAVGFRVIELIQDDQDPHIPHASIVRNQLQAAAAAHNYLQQYDPDGAMTL
jgi:hypothetical protein